MPSTPDHPFSRRRSRTGRWPDRRTSSPPLAGRVALAALVAVMWGCAEPWPEPPAADGAAHAEAHERWRADREDRLTTPPGGPVLWVGLWDLGDGREIGFGSDPELPIMLAGSDVPPRAGTLRRTGEAVELVPEAGSGLRLHEGAAVTEPLTLRHDRTDEPTRLAIGSLGLRVHAEPGTDRLWLRAWDEAHPDRASFTLPEYFPVDPAWRVMARYEPYAEPRPIRLPDVTGGTVEYRAPGELVFRREDREHRLIVTAGEDSDDFFVMLWDSTATSSTYQGGRYLHVDFPDEAGWTTIDFNRTYNAPCVFTAYSVCALPPRENWLELSVTAGEKRPDKAPATTPRARSRSRS